MNFGWSYSLKPPVAPFPVISLKSFQNRVHRRLPLRQSFEVSGHLSMEVGIYELGWSVFIVFYRHSREYHLDLRLTVVSHDLKTSGLTSSVNSLGLYLDCPWLEGGGLYFSTKPFHLSLASDSVRGVFCRLSISSIALISLLRASPSPLSIHGLIYLLILSIGVLISGTERSRIGVLCINSRCSHFLSLK